MSKHSAGLVMFRIRSARLEVLLVHPGGPLWKNKDDGAWLIPKGALMPGEEALDAARREFEEETGFEPAGPFIELGNTRHKSGKLVTAWAFEGDCDPALVRSNTFTMEWPPRSGRRAEFPEVDRAAFFTISAARPKANAAEFVLLDKLEHVCRERGRLASG